jgi:uncharacterized protein YozE (UPF0346 family)
LLLTQRIESSRPQNNYLLNQSHEFNLSPGEIEIAKLMENKKDYDPNLIKNTLSEQNHIRQLAKIIVNLKGKDENEGTRNKLPQKFTIETLLGIIEERFEETIRDQKGEQTSKNFNEHKFPIHTNFEKNQAKQQKDFLTTCKFLIYYLIGNSQEPLRHKTQSVPPNKNNDMRFANVKDNIKNLQMLHDMDTFRFFKGFTFPIEIEDLKVFCKLNEKKMHTKMIKNLMVFEKIFTDYEHIAGQKDNNQADISTMIKHVSKEAFSKNNFRSMKSLNIYGKEYTSQPEMKEELRKHLQI